MDFPDPYGATTKIAFPFSKTELLFLPKSNDENSRADFEVGRKCSKRSGCPASSWMLMERRKAAWTMVNLPLVLLTTLGATSEATTDLDRSSSLWAVPGDPTSRTRACRSRQAFPVSVKVVGSDEFGRHQLIVLLGNYSDVASAILEFEHGYPVVRRELRSDGSTDKRGHLLRTERHVLFDLYSIQLVVSSLGLHWHHIMTTRLVHAHIYFICLDLSDSGHSRTQVILK